MKKIYGAVIALLFSMLLSGTIYSQQMIFNIPTTDVLDKKNVELKPEIETGAEH